MPRRLLTSPRNLITRARITLRAGKLPRLITPTLEPVIARTGMNEWETRVANALDRLRIRYTPQASFLGGSVLGGGRMDFLLPEYQVDIEVNGPFHNTTNTAAHDALRNLGVSVSGLKVVRVGGSDFAQLERRILELIGRPI